jgi:hypothetical protein
LAASAPIRAMAESGAIMKFGAIIIGCSWRPTCHSQHPPRRRCAHGDRPVSG